MKKEIKCMEYYFDAKNYNKIEILQALEEELKKEFLNKKAKIRIQKNAYGIYVASLIFQNKRKKKEKLNLKSKQIRKENTEIFSKKKNQKNIKREEIQGKSDIISSIEKKITNKERKGKDKIKKDKRWEKYDKEEHHYGQYKQTGMIFKPY